MQAITYDITPIKQSTSECMQTATAQMLGHFNKAVTVQQIIDNVPVYVNDAGEKIGTSPGHLAAYLVQSGYKTVVYTFDVELFDRSWSGESPGRVIELLEQRQKHIPSNSWLAAYHDVLVDGWRLFAESGGVFEFEQLSSKLLHDQLQKGPFIVMVNSTYFNGVPKARYDQDKNMFKSDAISGRSLTHAMTCAGYKDGSFLVVDPDPPKGVDHTRWVEQDHLIASIMAAQTESDNMLITVTK